MKVRLRLLGRIQLEDRRGAELDTVLRQPKRLALLAYLRVASPRGFHRRDTLLSLLWPERSESRARNAHSQAVYHLRRSLGDDVVISRGPEELGVDPSNLSCDTDLFDDSDG